MLKGKKILLAVVMAIWHLLIPISVSAQGNIDNGTRAVFIFDIAKYIDYGQAFKDSSVFKIGVLDKTSEDRKSVV